YSYRFDIVPLELISSIYEEFYQSSAEEPLNKTGQDGAYYTPPVLVEFVLSRVLTSEILQQSPRVLDPACGSGIFLVEAFRRIIRHAWQRKWLKENSGLTFNEIKNILKEQISGMEVNEEASKVAAFSLYLSMLHFLDPPAIDKQIKMGNKLPNLVASKNKSSNHYHIILPFQAPPLRVECRGIFETYRGKRLLIKRGITERGEKRMIETIPQEIKW
ncbi:MAG: N-6 DNA methylase, partial [Spirochaetales bacterium]|nr:N-6 DNA methylase [Spirochaetales bacterium]